MSAEPGESWVTGRVGARLVAHGLTVSQGRGGAAGPAPATGRRFVGLGKARHEIRRAPCDGASHEDV
jgi:hypothetical protein